MYPPARRLSEYCQERIGHNLRAVGHHTGTSFETTYLREDLEEEATKELMEHFVNSSRALQEGVSELKRYMGPPEASLHMLEEGFLIQFHTPDQKIIFLVMERDIGRNLTGFIDDCNEAMF